MKVYKILGMLAVFLLMSLVSTQVFAFDPCAGGFPFPTIADDEATVSLGKYRVWVHPNFQPLFADNPIYADYYDAPSGKLETPTLEDPNTKIGVSVKHQHGTTADLTTGVSVGFANTPISDADFSLMPAGFQGGTDPTIWEAHTEIVQFNLTDPSLSGMALRSGLMYDLFSPGEVESLDADSPPELPGESFFNVSVEVDLPNIGGQAITTLYNPTPLLITSNYVCPMPPAVIYIHENPEAVPLLFRSDHPTDPANNWHANDLMGYLILAGHGVMDSANANWSWLHAALDAAWNDPSVMTEMPIPTGSDIPTLSEWGMIIFCALLFAWMAWMVVRRRRAPEVGI